MKTKITVSIVGCLCGLLLATQPAFSQGSLTPPGAPGPTFKTLSQIEPRTPISSAPFIITNSGSYYLTTNLSVTAGDVITVSNCNVTLDLNGFSISSTADPAGGTGILLGLRANASIFNGYISGAVTNNGGVFAGSGFARGIFSTFLASGENRVRVTDVTVSGCLIYGILLGSGYASPCVVKSCTVYSAGDSGIQAQTISDSSAVSCGSHGIYAQIANNCSGHSIASGGYGVYANTAINCYGYNTGNGGYGLSANVANNCYGYNNAGSGGYGLFATSANNCYGYSLTSGGTTWGLASTTAVGCYGWSFNGTGLQANTASHCYGYVNSGTGIGLTANITIGCYGHSFGGVGLNGYIANSGYGEGATPIAVSFKYNMP